MVELAETVNIQQFIQLHIMQAVELEVKERMIQAALKLHKALAEVLVVEETLH
jgi:hypothetical protein